MAVSFHLLPRQFGGGDFEDRNGNNDRNISTLAIVGIVIGLLLICIAIAFVVLTRARRRRKALKAGGHALPLHNRPGTSGSSLIPSPYSSKPQGYQSTPDQNQSLLGNAAAPGNVAWDADHIGVGSTQDGFGFTTANITRPASVANFDAPPPRYEEAAGASATEAGGLRPLILATAPDGHAKGEAASYYNASSSSTTRDGERGRSATRDEGSRGRALSVDNRSANSDRRRSLSRFREEGMDDVSLAAGRKS